jgi:cellulose synthase/poly-beta-1,6-N-acetylglucosamine synthase-like glycosyltransferase
MPNGVCVVFNDGIKGLSETRNIAINVATGNIIAFMDDDAIAETDWLEKLVQQFKNSAVMAIGGMIVPYWLEGERPFWFPGELDWIVGCTYLGLPHRGNVVRNIIGCNMAFRTEVFHSIGLFNTSVGRTSKSQGIGEDSELCMRITSNLTSAIIVYDPLAIVHHKVPVWRVQPGYLIRRSYDEGYHKSTVKKLHSNSPFQPLSTENSYLRYLVFTSIFQRLRYIYRWESFPQLGAIMTCIAATGAGYLHGQLRRHKIETEQIRYPIKASK